MRRPQPDALRIWGQMIELELRWARRWRDNVAKLPRSPEWVAHCRQRMREYSLRWREYRRSRRALLGQPDISHPAHSAPNPPLPANT